MPKIMFVDLEKPCKDHGRHSSLAPEGYALVGRPGVRSRCVGLHRLTYCASVGCSLEDIHGKVVRHKCDNPRCIEPTHLELGTRADNNRDRAERGRSAKVVHTKHKLSAEQARTIQLRYNPKRDPINGVVALAREFRVDPNVIYQIVRGEHNCLA